MNILMNLAVRTFDNHKVSDKSQQKWSEHVARGKLLRNKQKGLLPFKYALAESIFKYSSFFFVKSSSYILTHSIILTYWSNKHRTKSSPSIRASEHQSAPPRRSSFLSKRPFFQIDELKFDLAVYIILPANVEYRSSMCHFRRHLETSPDISQITAVFPIQCHAPYLHKPSSWQNAPLSSQAFGKWR